MAFDNRSNDNKSRNGGFRFERPERKKVPYSVVFLIALGVVLFLAIAQFFMK